MKIAPEHQADPLQQESAQQVSDSLLEHFKNKNSVVAQLSCNF
jgi:hypothetical protein